MKKTREKYLSLPKKVEIKPETLGLPANLREIFGSKNWDELSKKNQTYFIFGQLLKEGNFILTGEGKVVRI
ncbi:MAG: hypothetical protein AABW48_03505 [Nanoarchaeota archaeon]